MAKRKSSNQPAASTEDKGATAVAAANKAQGIPEQPPVATVATVVATPPAPKQKRGKSSLASPVAFVWANSHNLCSAAIREGKPVPTRKVLVDSAINQGIAYYTARTQVQAFLQASAQGTRIPAKLPKGLTLGAAS